MAVKLASALGASPEFWLNAQQAVDVHNAKKKIKAMPEPLIDGRGNRFDSV